jgi:hypothetical protein
VRPAPVKVKVANGAMLSEQGFDDTKDARYQNASEHGNACELAKFAKLMHPP